MKNVYLLKIRVAKAPQSIIMEWKGMEIGEKRKIVYDDDNQEKVIKGIIEDIDEFTISIKPFGSNQNITIGKRVLRKSFPIGGNSNE